MGRAPGFHDRPKVLYGASHIVNQALGPGGRHALDDSCWILRCTLPQVFGRCEIVHKLRQYYSFCAHKLLKHFVTQLAEFLSIKSIPNKLSCSLAEVDDVG